uniref:Olfactory receptor C family, n1 n=1 Tax=Myripristis murdjan TaxID=586833 RepID=A0A667X373_9TELE
MVLPVVGAPHSRWVGNTLCSNNPKLLGRFDMPSLFKQGDVMIGGIFPIFNKQVIYHNDQNLFRFDLRAFRWTQVMIFAIEEINNHPTLLPNISLGYRILNSCGSPPNALRAALMLVSSPEEMESNSLCPPPISAIIAEAGSSRSLAVAEAFGPFQVPIVSYFSTCACLSDKTKYPTFFRTIPSDFYQAKALAALVKRFGWQWIGAIQSDNDYGRSGILGFTKEVEKLGVCVAFVGTVLRTYKMDKILHVVEMIQKSTIKVILAFAEEADLYLLMKEILKQNITGIQWIASEAWITAARPSTPEIYRSFGGAIGFVARKMAIPKLRSFLAGISPYTNTGDAFFNVTELRVSYNVYKAVYAVAHALHHLLFCQPFEEKPVRPCLNISEIQPKEVRNILDGQVQHVTVGHFASAANREYELSIQEEKIVNDYKPSGILSMVRPTWPGSSALIHIFHSCLTGAAECTPCPQEYWSNERRDKCILKTVEFLSYHEPMGIALTAVSLLGAFLSLATMLVFIRYRETPVIKASNSELSCFLLFSLFMCFLCPLTFIGRPTVWTCMLRHTAFGVTFALCISCVLGKTIVVVTAFRATVPGNKMAAKFGPVQQRIIVCSCTLFQIIICILWLKLNSPFPDMVFRYSKKKIVLECNTGSEAAFYAVLGYIGILAAICLVLAFLARKLPDNFNEAKFITFSMLIFCAVWITFIPAYVSSPGKFTVAVEIFAILSSAFGLLISIFAPKCYIILIKPERNNKRHAGRLRHRLVPRPPGQVCGI